MYRVCIVAPDIIGPIKNGGIGTHCYWLARLYASLPDHAVTVLFTAPVTGARLHAASFAQAGIEFVSLDAEKLPSYPEYGLEWFGVRAARARSYLRSRHFDVVHFQDWQANGFESVRSKKMGLDFEHTVLVTTLHSPTRWSMEGTTSWSSYPTGDCKLHYAERYVCENSDVLVSPTRHMFDWAQDKGWKLPDDRRIISCVFPEKLRGAQPAPCDASHLIFFGRLETRKGLEVFCNAVEVLASKHEDHGIRRVTFLGKNGQAGGTTGVAYIDKYRGMMGGAGIDVHILDDYDAMQAMRFLCETGGVAVMPSLVDNHPYTVVECLETGVPFLASNVGGIPELVGDQVLFSPRPGDLAQALLERHRRLRGLRRIYNGAAAAKAWSSLTSDVVGKHVSQPRKNAPVRVHAPKVSVCVPHYNHGAYLPQLLHSLATNDYSNVEVVVVDDGSNDPESIESLHELQRTYGGRGWLFYSKPNGGPGEARNVAASCAGGEYLIFMDADNIAISAMVSKFVRALEKSGADCLTCHMSAFAAADNPFDEIRRPLYTYAPLGPCLEVGQLENVFGDTNFIIRRDVFLESGGFSTGHGSGDEDWAFLARLALSGATLDVVPDALFFYRHLDHSFSRRHDPVAGRRRVAAAYRDHGHALDMDMMVSHMLAPLHKICVTGVEEIHRLNVMVAERDARIAALERALGVAQNGMDDSRRLPQRTFLESARVSLSSALKVARGHHCVPVRRPHT